ncbi:hypothetical protein LUZ60_010152 [Juncus effusus]|nr:hypothetical protein LUZ60_010152 [Juncus effusus]
MAALNTLCFSSAFSLTSAPPSSLTPARSVRFGRPAVIAAVSAKKEAASAPREPRGIMKPKPISPELQAICGVPEIARTQALKLIWAHIKEHQLQDPQDKKVIVCDEKLLKIFGKERVGFLEIAKLISPHFSK